MENNKNLLEVDAKPLYTQKVYKRTHETYIFFDK